MQGGPPQYEFGHGSHPFFPSNHDRMAKRRRMLHHEGDAGPSELPQQSPNAPLHYPGHGQDLAYPGQHPANAFSSPAACPPGTVLTEGPGVAQSTSLQPKQWDLQHAQMPLPYPDTSSYQQSSYFSQQTDPSIYKAPWPPAAAPAAIYTPADVASTASQSGTMPFFPGNPSMGTTDGLEGAASFHHGYQDLTSAPREYAVPQATIEGQGASSLYLEDASMHLKIQSLTILENLATQLIHTFARANYAQIQDLVSGKDTEEGQAYAALKNLFDQTRKVYSRDTQFIDAIAIQIFQPAQQEVVRQANIATFISSILGAHDVSFYHLNEFFLETFVPLGHRLLKWQGAMYLELKTQTYISALINSDGSREAMLDELFPPDLDAQILSRHPDAPSLSPSEQDFIDRSRARKSYLLAGPSTDEALRELPGKYQWSDFVREFASCINKNIDGIMNVSNRSQSLGGTADRRSGAAFLQPNGRSKSDTSSGANAPTTTHREGQPAEPPRRNTATASTVRQTWTKSEEDALLSGLERVKGPHWSQILAFYGRGGSVSEVLKDRNQVQLKDKARNLKLWYLKMGKEVPVALQGVTGELGKRGGARARAALGLLEEREAAEDERSADQASLDPSLGRAKQGKKGGR